MPPTKTKRAPLTRERIITAAVALADESGAKGASAVTMRALAASLGVEAMSLYNHVKGRDGLLDGMVDAVFAEIELPAPGPWRDAMRGRAHSAREALRRHPWAIGLMDSRSTPGLSTLRHHDAVLGALRAGGFSIAMTAHAVSVIDGYLYGFVMQETSLPFQNADEAEQVTGDIVDTMPADAFPHLAEMAMEYVLKPGYDYGDEFSFGLDLILNALHPDEA